MKYKSDRGVEIYQIGGEIPDFEQSGPAAQFVNSGLVSTFGLKKKSDTIIVSCQELHILK